ncbi:MAG: HAMP domain-containing histidine kinase [Clostridia bacterium]|nr:HAMP domain-containing histidine kinase [Clostridia bacterium]
MGHRMFSKLNNMILSHFKLSIIVVNDIVIIAVLALFYPIFPTLMGYPPDAIQISKLASISIDIQFIVAMIISIVAGTLSMIIALKDFDKLDYQAPLPDQELIKFNNIRKKSINLPYLIYIFQLGFLFVPSVFILAIAMVVNNAPLVVIIRILSLVFTISSLIAIVSHVFVKRIFTALLLKIHTEDKIEGIRISLKTKIFLQIIPMFMVSILFTGMLGYARIMEEKGDLTYRICRDILYNARGLEQATTVEQIFQAFKYEEIENAKITCFVVLNGKFIDSDHYKPTLYFNYFLNHPVGSKHDRVYGDTNEVQGVVRQINGAMGNITVGIKYELTSPKTLSFFIIAFLSILIMFSLILYYIIMTFVKEITIVSKRLNEISEGNDIAAYHKIPVTSNDELSDLVIEFNRLRVKQFEYDKLKTEFLANISHELRTPINLLFSSIQLLELYIKGGIDKNLDKFGKSFKGMKQNCLRLLRLINNLIDVTKIDAGYLELHLKTIDIVNHIERIAMSTTGLMKSKGITLEFDTEEEEVLMSCDLDKIETIVLNLLSNAIKFTKENGRVFVNLFCREDTFIISIRDTGIGIPADKLETIFERFRQVEQSLVRSHEGSGIGLSLVKSLVKLHGGSIGVISEEGVGSEFIIELPIMVIPGSEEVPGAFESENVNSSGVKRVNVEFSDIYDSD